MMKRKLAFIFLVIPFICSCGSSNKGSSLPDYGEINIKNENYFHYFGRHIQKNDGVYFTFSASGFEVKVNVKEETNNLSIKLKHLLNGYSKGYVSVFVDDELNTKLAIESSPSLDLEIVKSLSVGEHYIRLNKCNESNYSKITLLDCTYEGMDLMVYDKKHEKRIEFIGDSITCGYGNLATTKDTFSLETEDACYSYGYLCANELGFDYSIVSQSGISLIMNEFGSTYYIKDLYKTIDGSEEFDRSKYALDYALINIGTNDNTSFKKLSSSDQNTYATKFYNEYLSLANSILDLNKNVKFIFCYNMMVRFDAFLVAAIENVKNTLNENSYEDIAYSCEFAMDYSGADGHPGKDAHIRNASIISNLIGEIENE